MFCFLNNLFTYTGTSTVVESHHEMPEVAVAVPVENPTQTAGLSVPADVGSGEPVQAFTYIKEVSKYTLCDSLDPVPLKKTGAICYTICCGSWIVCQAVSGAKATACNVCIFYSSLTIAPTTCLCAACLLSTSYMIEYDRPPTITDSSTLPEAEVSVISVVEMDRSE